jgi:hypothetical protein
LNVTRGALAFLHLDGEPEATTTTPPGGMSMPAILDNAAHWRARAKESRVLAEQLHDPESRRMMLTVAESYERLADHADRRIAEKDRVSLVPDRYK